jgi:hypothetical protein
METAKVLVSEGFARPEGGLSLRLFDLGCYTNMAGFEDEYTSAFTLHT